MTIKKFWPAIRFELRTPDVNYIWHRLGLFYLLLPTSAGVICGMWFINKNMWNWNKEQGKFVTNYLNGLLWVNFIIVEVLITPIKWLKVKGHNHFAHEIKVNINCNEIIVCFTISVNWCISVWIFPKNIIYLTLNNHILVIKRFGQFTSSFFFCQTGKLNTENLFV